MSYTKGPWQYVADKSKIIALSDWIIKPNESEQEEGLNVTVVSLFGAMGGDDSTADANLIASAPELLEVLEKISFEADYDEPADLEGLQNSLLFIKSLADNIIIKAKGL